MKLRLSAPTRQVGTPQAGRAQLLPAVLVFLHIPRTAGSTLRRILESHYGRNAVLSLYDSSFGDEVATLTPEELVRTRVIAGHFYFGVHNHLPGRYCYLTFLRDPVERVVSHYHFVRRQPGHYLYPAASTMSLPEYVRFCGAAEPNNDETRLLAGKEMASSDGTCSPAMLPAARRNLDSFAVVGLTEAFDASLISMRRLFDWGHPYYVRHNVGSRPSRGEGLSAEVLDVIRAYNTLDIELYSYARERFERQVAEQGDAFTRELRLFRHLNAIYGKLHGLVAAPTRRLAMRRA